MTILAPYGHIDYLPLSTKVGEDPKGGERLRTDVLAPYGDMDFLPLSTKVGDNKQDPEVAPLAPYGDMDFLPLSVKVGVNKEDVPPSAAHD